MLIGHTRLRHRVQPAGEQEQVYCCNCMQAAAGALHVPSPRGVGTACRYYYYYNSCWGPEAGGPAASQHIPRPLPARDNQLETRGTGSQTRRRAIASSARVPRRFKRAIAWHPHDDLLLLLLGPQPQPLLLLILAVDLPAGSPHGPLSCSPSQRLSPAACRPSHRVPCVAAPDSRPTSPRARSLRLVLPPPSPCPPPRPPTPTAAPPMLRAPLPPRLPAT